MNILPKKSWHVRTRKNIERVQRDETEAKEKNRLAEKRRLQIEQELRIEELRKRACYGSTTDNNEYLSTTQATQGHINLFDLELGQSSVGSTTRLPSKEEALSEKKAKSETRWRDKSHDSDKDDFRHEQPWYLVGGSKNKLPDQFRGLKDELCHGLPNPCVLSAVYNTKTNKSNHHSMKFQSPKPDSNAISSIYDPLIAMRQAEEICRSKRNLQRLPKQHERYCTDSNVRFQHDSAQGGNGIPTSSVRPSRMVLDDGAMESGKNAIPKINNINNKNNTTKEEMDLPGGGRRRRRDVSSSPEIVEIVNLNSRKNRKPR